MVTRKKASTTGSARTTAKRVERPISAAVAAPVPKVIDDPKSIQLVPPQTSWPTRPGHFDLAHALSYVEDETPIRFDQCDIPYLLFSTRAERYPEASLRIEKDGLGASTIQFGTIGNDMGWATLNVSLDKELLLSNKYLSYILEIKSEKRMVVSVALRVHPETGGWIDSKLRSQVIGPEYPVINDAVIIDVEKFQMQGEFRDPVLIFYFPLAPFSVEIRKIIVQ